MANWKNQERCDRCGKWVAYCNLVWSDETYIEAICKKCEAAQQQNECDVACQT